MKRVPPNQAKRKRGYVFFRFSSIKLSKICNFHLWKCWKETRSRNTGNQTTSGEHRWIYVPLTLHQIKDWVVEGTKMQLQSTYQSLALLTSSPTLSFWHCISRLSTWPTLPPQSKKKSAAVSLRALHSGEKFFIMLCDAFFSTSLHACHELHVSWTRLPQCRIHNLAQQGLSKTKCWNSHSADLTALFTALRTYLNRKGCANESSPRYFSWFEARFRRCWIDMMACSLSMKSGQKPTIFHFESKLVQFCLASSFISKRKKHYFVGFLCTFVRQWVSPGTCLENQK